MDYYTQRTTYGLHDDDLYGVPRPRSSHYARTVLDDNDSISRRSRLNDARVLGNMSSTVNALNAPTTLPPVPRPIPITRPPPHGAFIRPVSVRPANVRVGAKAVRKQQVPGRRVNVINTNYIYPVQRTTNDHRYILQEEPATIRYRPSERIEALDLQRTADSLNSLKRHVVDIQAGLGSQRMLLDRYLPIELGPTPSVDQGVNKKYFELAVRMPNLEPETYKKRTYLQDELSTRALTPHAMRSQSVEPALIAYIASREANASRKEPRQVGSSVAPMSETRKNIRKLITKTRRDPNFYN